MGRSGMTLVNIRIWKWVYTFTISKRRLTKKRRLPFIDTDYRAGFGKGE